MERDRLNFNSLRKGFIIFVVFILAGTWLAEFFFDENYVDPIYTYFEFWLYFIIPIFLWVIYSRLSSSGRKEKARIKLKKDRILLDFKAVARFIKVNFDDCEITQKEYEKEVILRKDTKYQERKIVRFSECQIKHINLENGTPVLYESPTLYMEIINLRYKLHQQKETILYVDQKGSNRFIDENGMSSFADDERNPYYYFDLEFLGDSVLSRPTAEVFYVAFIPSFFNFCCVCKNLHITIY